jgi:hypothetical protein
VRRSLGLLLMLAALGCSDDNSTGGAGGAAGAAAGGSSGSSGGGGSSGSAGSASGGQSGQGASGASGASGGGAGAGGCDLASVEGLAVAEVDLDAFPPYAVDGCRLLYVSTGGELRRRELGDGSESLLAPATDRPRRPTLSGSVMAWEADVAGKSAVVVSSGGEPQPITGAFDHAGEPRATGDAVVFTAWLGADPNGDTDVLLFDVASASLELVGGGAKQQRFADVSATHVAYSDFSEDDLGYYRQESIGSFSLADIVLVERESGQKRSIARPDKQAFPMLGADGVLGFLEWVGVHPVPKFEGYRLQSVPLAAPGSEPTLIADVRSSARVRPLASGSLFEWVARYTTGGTLFRALADGSATPVEVPITA